MIDPSKPNATIELETADLLQLGQSGLVQPAVNKTRELQLSDLEELREGMPIEDPKVMVDLGPDPDAAPKEQNVFVDFGPDPTSQPARAGSVQMRASSPLAAQPGASASGRMMAQPSIVVEPSMVEQQRPPAPAPIPAGAIVAPPVTATPVGALVTPPVRVATPVNVQRVTPTMPRVERRATSQIGVPRRSGMGLVVLVYLVSAAALAVSIYLRWFA